MTTPTEPVKFTAEERQGWIDFCEMIAENLGVGHGDFNDLTDEQLDEESDWYYELSGK